MAKNQIISNPAFVQPISSKTASQPNFNLVNKTTNFNSIFDVRPLEADEIATIENLLIEGSNPESFTEIQVKTDIDFLTTITAEIKAIGRQGILLMGERVAHARERLKSYHNGTFTKWLNATFGSRKTGYNILTYYDFYSSLPDADLKEKFRKFPQKTAYILASRQGDMKQKEEILRNSSVVKSSDLISLIQAKLPIQSNDKRGGGDATLKRVIKLQENLKLLFPKKHKISKDERLLLQELKEAIEFLLTTS